MWPDKFDAVYYVCIYVVLAGLFHLPFKLTIRLYTSFNEPKTMCKSDMWCQYSMSWTGCLSMPVLTIRWFTLLLLSAWPCSKISVSVINTSSNHLRSAHVNLLYVSNEICLAAAFFSLSSTSVWNALSPSLRTCTTFMVSSLALRPNFLKLL